MQAMMHIELRNLTDRKIEAVDDASNKTSSISVRMQATMH